MKIAHNEEILNYLDRASENILKKDGLDNETYPVKDTKAKEDLLKKQQSYDSNIDTIYADENLIFNNPYYKNINIEKVKSNEIKYDTVVLKKDIAIATTWVLPSKDRDLNDYVELKAFKSNIKIPRLMQGADIWMSPTLAEFNTINPCVDKAYGRVLTFGLGLGYFPYMCSLKDNVKSVTIIEWDANIIKMFKEYILPQFNTTIPINIINGNAYDYFSNDFLDKFDYIFVDIWKSNTDGLAIITSLLEINNYKGNIDYWIEFSCYHSIRTILIIYFKCLINGNLTETISKMKRDTWMGIAIRKIHKYFRRINKTIETADELKDMIYSSELIREILSLKI